MIEVIFNDGPASEARIDTLKREIQNFIDNPPQKTVVTIELFFNKCTQIK